MASQTHCLLIFSILLAVATTTAAVDEPTVHHNVDPGHTSPGNNTTTTETRKLHRRDRYISSQQALNQNSIPSGETRMSSATCDDVESPSHARMLWQKPGRDRYITYAALRADSIPCGWQGSSYYDCTYSKRVNPYHRGCSAATRCFRYTH